MISHPTPPPGPAVPPELPLSRETSAPRGRGWRWLRLLAALILALAIVGAGTALGLARYGGAYDAHAFATRLDLSNAKPVKGDPAVHAKKLAARLAALAPKDVHVVVDSYNNRLRVYRGGELLREAVCSTGSGIRLRDPRDGREWFFDTPQGEFRIQNKKKNPMWIKPDWAFIEEGFLPPKNDRYRVDDFSLGDYGLYMRDGYIIHGTIFKTLLGKRVTHGCIRLGDEDLKFVFDTVPINARVYLF